MRSVPTLEASIEIAAPVAKVWAMVSDVRRMPEWSPQVQSTRLRTGFDEVGLGAQFTNRNVNGEAVWTTHAEIVRFEVEREMAFRVEENWLIWSFVLEQTAAGTRLTQRREQPEGISELSHELTVGFFGGHDAFTEVMRASTADTLTALKAAAEA
ncbi:polyketide cyclase [Nocardioides baekrokdamisoli]|uniref:Polyketide cyclase n=1 Tax=Nocardioides baekrokdamisoli TaxID=1804624 RepID=A0A3G9IHE4_9ACTN|nr:SRPBCC family protein [Nocardioides baekrokdamisoli]BBH17622.1 polyketide cyclase [Nocardioides baekrokdamisoli]